MKPLQLVLRDLHHAENALTRELAMLADRHRVEHEIHHVALDLARWSRQHVRDLGSLAGRHGMRLSERPAGPPGAVRSGLRRRISDLLGRRPEPGVLLLRDLRHLHRAAAGVSADWVMLGQVAQATKDSDLLALTRRCHPQTLRQLRWANGMVKVLSPQILN